MSAEGLNFSNDKARFRNFRDNILPKINKNIDVRATDMVDIKWELMEDNFIQYYNCVIFIMK